MRRAVKIISTLLAIAMLIFGLMKLIPIYAPPIPPLRPRPRPRMFPRA